VASNTANLNLRKPTNQDVVNVATDLSENFDKIDAHVTSPTAHSGTSGWPVAAPGGVDDTAIVQAAINAANSAGGGRIVFSFGTYVCTTLTLYSNVHLDLAGATLKLKNSANADLLKTDLFASLTGGTTQAGPSKFSISNGILDGNQANNASGWPLRVYGSSYRIANLEIKNGKSGGAWTEWGTGGTDMEAHWSNFRIHDCTGNGLDVNGPHDSVFVNGHVFKNTGKGVHVGTNGGGGFGAVFVAVHSWGTEQDYAFDLEGSCILDGCEGEGASLGQVYVRSNRIAITGGEYFGVAGDPTSVGIIIGDGIATPDRLLIDTKILDCASSGLTITSGGTKSIIRALIVCAAAGTAVTGSFPSSTQAEIITNYNSVGGGTFALPSGGTFFTNGKHIVRANENLALQVQKTDETNVFSVNTNNKRIEVINGSMVRGYSDDFSTQVFNLDAATGAVRPGTTAGLGASIYSGSGAPADALGANGDWYLRTDGVAGLGLYRRLNGIWGVPYAPFAQSDIPPTGALAQTHPRMGSAIGDLAALSTGRLTLVGIMLPAGLTITSISFMSRTTALSVGTNQWFALFNNAASPVLLRQTADDTSTAWAANTVKTLNLSSTFTTTYSGLHYLGVMVAATTVPTLAGVSAAASAFAALAPVLNGTSTTGLTTPASFTSPALAPTATALNPYAYVS
jgi:hypothetical protein